MTVKSRSDPTRARLIQIAIVGFFVLAFFATSVIWVQSHHQVVLWTGAILIGATALATRRQKPSKDCAVGVAAVLFLSMPLVAIPILVGDNEGKAVGLLAAGLATASAQMLWAVARCPCREAVAHHGASPLRQGLLVAYGMAAVLSLWGLIGRTLYPDDLSNIFLGWTVAGYFASATVIGGLYPFWRHLLQFPLGALFAGGIGGSVVYWSLVPAEIVRESGEISWSSAWTDLGYAVIAGFMVGPMLMLHFFFKRTDAT